MKGEYNPGFGAFRSPTVNEAHVALLTQRQKIIVVYNTEGS